VKRYGLARSILVVVLFEAANCHGQGKLSLDVQNDDGNSRLTLSASANLVANNSLGPVGVAGFGISPANSLWQGPANFNEMLSLVDFAVVSNTTSGQNVDISGFGITSNSGVIGFIFSFSSTFFFNGGDAWEFIPSSASQTVPIPFSYFFPGTASTPPDSTFNLAFNTAFTVTVEPVPEPSTTVLLGLGTLAGGMARRRERWDKSPAVS